MSIFVDYLTEKKDAGELILVYCKSKTTGRQNRVNSLMLKGYVHSVDEDTLRLERQECIIERSDIISIKPEDGEDH